MDRKTDATLLELLNDPIIMVVMRRDGISRESMEQLFERIQRNRQAQRKQAAVYQ